MATSKEVASVVCDAGPLIHLYEVDCLTLLSDFSEVLVPNQVWVEVAKHQPLAISGGEPLFRRVTVSVSNDAPFQSLVRSLSLDLGEQAALSLMANQSAAILLTDDAAARVAALSLGHRVHGTVGILLRAIRRQQKSKKEVLDILRDLPTRSSLYIRAGLLDEIIDRVKNEGV